jgi:hypothetical protein
MTSTGDLDTIYQSLKTGTATQQNSESLRITLTRAVRISESRRRGAGRVKYGSTAINDQIHAMNSAETNVFPGKAAGWLKRLTFNRTTLAELGLPSVLLMVPALLNPPSQASAESSGWPAGDRGSDHAGVAVGRRRRLTWARAPS